MGRVKPSLPIASIRQLVRLAMGGIDRVTWYDRAYRELSIVCDCEQWELAEFAAELAILSPRCSVRRNIRMALEYHGNGRYFANTMGPIKAAMAHYVGSGIIRGKKTGPFRDAILGDELAIVLDTWMAKALLIEEFNPDSSAFRTVATRESSCSAVRKTADSLGLTPRDCQAAIWSGIVREWDIKPIFFPILEEYRRWIDYGREFPLVGTIDEF